MRTGHFGVLASVAANEEGEPWLNAAITTLHSRRQQLAELLAEHLPNVGYYPPEAGYLAWLDMRRLSLDSEPASALRTHAKVAVTPGHTYGNDTAGYIRLNFATSVELLTKAIHRIATATAYRAGDRRG